MDLTASYPGDGLRLALLQEERYLPTYHGGNKSNRCLLEALAARGYRCLALAAARLAGQGEAEYAEDMKRRGVAPTFTPGSGYRFQYRGVSVHGLPMETSRRHHFLLTELRAFQPEVVLVSADPRYYLLRAGLAYAAESGAKVIFIVHSNEHLPCGPLARRPDADQVQRLRDCDAIITVSRYGQEYLLEHVGLHSSVMRFPVYGNGPFDSLGRQGEGAVTLLNPHPTKGLGVFRYLAERFPKQEFAALHWGGDGNQAALPANVRWLEPVDDITDVLAGTQILLMPSLLPETFGLAAVEAMLHGIPIIAGNLGGVGEAMGGIAYRLPVTPCIPDGVGGYEIPRQNGEPWCAALGELLGDGARYKRLAEDSRDVAARLVSAIQLEDFEKLFDDLLKMDGQQSQPVAVVDAFEGSFLLAQELQRRGHPCVNVISNEAIASEVLEDCDSLEFLSSVQHEGDVGATLARLRGYGVSKVLPGCETGVEVSDALSSAIGCISNGSRLSEARRNKYLMAMAAQRSGVAVPEQCCSDRLQEIRRWRDQHGRWPVVAKPPHSLGSEDVQVCRDDAELARAFARILGRTNITGRVNHAVIAEELLYGPQYVLDTVSLEGEHFLAGVWLYGRPEFADSVIGSPDDPSQWHPLIRHLSWDEVNYAAVGSNAKRLMPGDDARSLALYEYACSILDALEINNGPAHFEIIWMPDGPRLMEVGARLHGAPSTHWMCRICTGVSQLDLTIDAYLYPRRFRLRARRRYRLQWHGYKYRLHPWRGGYLAGFRGLDRIESLRSFRRFYYMSEPRFLAPGNCVGVVALIHPDEDVMLADVESIRALERQGLYDLTAA